MGGISGFVYSENYLKYFLGEDHPFQQVRCKLTLELLKKMRAFDSSAKIFEARKAKEEELLLVHSKDYVNFVKEMSKKGYGFLDYGDTPAYKGIFEGACYCVGGTLKACELIMEGEIEHAFNFAGGLHHALPGSASGFCVFNDIAIGIRYLQKNFGLEKIAVVDIDAHHGDGTQKIFYSEPILKVSLHRIGIFPGSGYAEEIGEGKGKGYSVNIPLPPRTFDEAYLYAFNEVVIPLLKNYKPEIIINQFGIDSHFKDRLADLSLTTKAYEEIADKMHKIAHEVCDGRYLVLGGGGYDIDATVRCWALAFLKISGVREEKLELLRDKERIEKDERIFEVVRENVKRIKELVFPFHKID